MCIRKRCAYKAIFVNISLSDRPTRNNTLQKETTSPKAIQQQLSTKLAFLH